MNKTIGFIITITVFVMFNSQPANSETLTFVAEGVVTEIYVNEYPQPDPSPFEGIIAVGDPFRFEYEFDPSTPDFSPGNPDRGDYVNAILDCTVEAGSYSASFDEDKDSYTYVFNNILNYPQEYDEYSLYVRLSGADLGEYSLNNAGLSIRSAMGNPLPLIDDSLLAVPPDITDPDWSSMGMVLGFRKPDPTFPGQILHANVRADITYFGLAGPSTEELLQELVTLILELNLQQGISNALDAKLDTVLSALDDTNSNNDVAAINSLNAFINAVEAQRGNKISEFDADYLIDLAQQTIDMLSS